MKRFTKLIGLLLSTILVFSVAACNSETGNTPTDDGQKPVVVPDTEIVLAENGVSSYKIVIKEGASAADYFSAEELQTYIELSTGATLPLVVETDGASYGSKVLSVGRTKLLEDSGIEVSYDELGRDGFKIERKGDAVYICGGLESGTAFGVFEFLHDEVGYEAYSAAEIAYDKHTKLMVKDFHKSDKPAIPERYMDGTMHTQDLDSSYRYRFVNEYVSPAKYTTYGLDTYVSGCSAHALHDLVPRAQNIGAHPDWYPANAQICLSNEEMFETFIGEIEKRLDSDRKGYRISLGQEDGFTAWCPCEKCTAEREKYTGTGYWIRFCNRVVERIEQYLSENQPGRKIEYTAFAYSIGFYPPVDDNGNLVDESCRPNEKMSIRICTGGFCHYHNFDDPNCETNRNLLVAIENWKKITDKFTVWAYSALYSNYLPFYDNFGIMQSEIQLYRDLNCENLFMEYNSGSNMMSFDYLRCYLFGKLCWNPDVDVAALTDNFFKHYYGEVATEMRDIFDTYRDYIAKQNAVNGCTGNSGQLFDEWSRNFVDGMIDKVNAVLDKCKALPDTERGEVLYNRILGERVAILFCKLYSYEKYGYPMHELAATIDRFEDDVNTTGTRSYREGHSVSEFISEMRNKLYA